MKDTFTQASRATFHVSSEAGAMAFTMSSLSTAITSADYPFSETVHVQLSDHDMNNINSMYPMGSGVSSTFISLQSAFARDTFRNEMHPVAVVQVSEYVADVTQPQFVSYTLDMNTNTLFLIFDETLDPSSIDFSQISLQVVMIGPLRQY